MLIVRKFCHIAKLNHIMLGIRLKSDLNKFDVDLLTELTRREKAAGIFPEPEVDLFMKVLT